MASALPPALTNAVKNLDGTRRFLALGAIAAALVLLWVASGWATGPTFVPLFRELEIGAVGAVTDALTKSAVPYRLEDGGTTVTVPQEEIARAKVLLAQEGLPGSGKPGLELFDKPTWGMTDFTQRITYRRALEGELARTIGALKGVEKAQVHLAIPEASALRKLEKQAEAAVVVTLRPGVALGEEEVQGIAYIVSSSVEGLPSENVAVMDNSGRVLSVPASAGGATYAGSTRQLDLQRNVELQLQDKAEQLLSTVVGAGKARVQVSAALNFDQIDRTTEQYDPEGQVLDTEQKSETAGDPAAGGSGSQTVISNAYANSKKLERRIAAVGSIDRLTVAVLVDDQAMTKQTRATAQSAEAVQASLQTLVGNALGLDSARGDRISVAAVPFEIQATALAGLVDTTTPPVPLAQRVQTYGRPGILLVGVLMAFALAWRLLKQPTGAAVPALAGAGAPAGALSGASAAAALEAGGAHGAPQLYAGHQQAVSASLQLRARVQAESTDRPETAAQVIRAWMGDKG